MVKRKSILCASVLVLGLGLICACTKEQDKGSSQKEEQTTPANRGTKRLAIRMDTQSLDYYPLDLSRKTVVVNGLEYEPENENGSWYVYVEPSHFDVYVAYLVEKNASCRWYAENPATDVLIPNVQYLGRQTDLAQIPLFARLDNNVGDYLDFKAPYAVLDLYFEGDAESVRLSSSAPSCGFVSWRRSDNTFIYEQTVMDVVLNCKGASGTTHYPVMVFGRNLSDVKVRVTDSSQTLHETTIGDIELQPGETRSFRLEKQPRPDGLLWYEGFDLCGWGGDAIAGKDGLVPEGQDSEYATVKADPAAQGSGYTMPESYIHSRGFDRYQQVLRCCEHPGYISVGTGSTSRGVFAMYPFSEDIGAVKNLEVSFRIALDPSIDDQVYFQAEGSSAIISKWTLDGAPGAEESLYMARTATRIVLNRELLGTGEWRTVRAQIENCTDATALKWLAATTSAGNHGFYLDDITVKEIPGSWDKDGSLRILYWNIQNGMWADQFGYDNFVKFVSTYSPDICVWSEARTNYESDSATWIPEDNYLPGNWAELASRYGHSYVSVSRKDNEGFPQAVTSRYPVEKLIQIDDLIWHGTGLHKVNTPKGDYYFVTLHLYPFSYWPNTPHEKQEESSAAFEGEKYRSMEMDAILQKTLLEDSWGASKGWFVLGDFNSNSRKDSAFIDAGEFPARYATHDLIAEKTALVDLIGTRYPGKYVSTTYGYSRFDYIYMDAATYDKVRNAGVLTTQWTAPVPTGISNFYDPSDHRPILVDINY